MRISDWSSDVCSSDLVRTYGEQQKDTDFAARLRHIEAQVGSLTWAILGDEDTDDDDDGDETAENDDRAGADEDGEADDIAGETAPVAYKSPQTPTKAERPTLAPESAETTRRP